MKNRSLDHVSKRRIDTLNSMVSKIDQQLNQVNQTLDLEWEKHVSKVKSKVAKFFNCFSESQCKQRSDIFFRVMGAILKRLSTKQS